MKNKFISFCSAAVVFVAEIIAPAPAQTANDVRSVAATELVLVYRCNPSDRVALRTYMQQRGLPRLKELQAQGVLASERVLFSRYVNADNWDLVVFLEFKNSSAAAKWKDVERSYPAGLDSAALKLVTSVATYPLDLIESGAAPNPSEKPVYLVLPYNFSVSADEYIAYVHDYVRPQVSGWIDEGVLDSYNMFIGRDAAGRPWSSWLLLKYKSDAALGARAATTAKIRAKLSNDPAWKKISDGKHAVRVELAAIIADELK